MSNRGDRGGSRGRGGGGGGRGFDARGGGGGRGGGRGGYGGPVIFKENVPPRIPDRLNPANQNKLIAVLQKVPKAPARPPRPGFGTAGTPIVLRSNFFALKTSLKVIYDYSIEIKPDDFLQKRKERVFQLIEEAPQVAPHRGYIAHDGSGRLVSAKKIPNLTVSVPFYEKGENGPKSDAITYMVSITFTRDLKMDGMNSHLNADVSARNYDPLPIVSALNLILRDRPQRLGVRVGQNKYFFQPPQNERRNLGQGIEAWRGFFMSVRPAYQQLMVNINVCMAPFVEPGNMVDVLKSFGRNSMGGMPTLPPALAKSIKVTTTHLGFKRRYKLTAIGTLSARQQTFPCEEYGTQPISVEGFFKRKYKKTLQHPDDVPVLNVGSTKRAIWLPAEICTIEPGNPLRGRLGDREVANMIKIACNPPLMNANFITNEGFSRLELTRPQLKDEFGLTVDLEMTPVPGRELPPARVSYKGGPVDVRNASWNITQSRFVTGGTVKSVCVLVVRDHQNPRGPDPTDSQSDIMALKNAFMKKLKSAGMNVIAQDAMLLRTGVLDREGRDPGRARSLALIKKMLVDKFAPIGKPSIIVVLLVNRDNYIYPGLKRIGDVELGIPTIHMQLEKALIPDPKQDQYLSNIALKVNTKLGGINHQIAPEQMAWLRKEMTMVIGIDVTHPGPGTKLGTPSIVAVVASIDANFVHYPATLGIQKPDVDKRKFSKEVVDDLDKMVAERLLVFKNANRRLPSRILVFRDGVSEGQYDIVVREELSKIKAAADRFSTKERYNPKVSIIICGKRHHARFYPVDSQHADRNGNTRPGTVVDKGITGVFDFDFYLQAHAGLQGSVKATHYNVIYDENSLGADEIQVGTHNASYMYARATKAVSLIPAAYYADLACERGRCYLARLMLDDASTVGGRNKSKEEEAELVWQSAVKLWGEGIHPDMKSTMFYI